MGRVALKSWAAGLELRGGVRASPRAVPRVLPRRAALFRNPRGPVARDHARHPQFLDYDYSESVRDYQYTKPRNSAIMIFSPLDAMLVPRHPPVDASPRWRKKGI